MNMYGQDHEYGGQPDFIMSWGENIESPLARAWKVLSKDPISSLLFLLYVLISVATFRHSTIGFASLEEGSLFWGAMAALAIDAGLILSATGLRSKRHPVSMIALVVGLVISVTASAYSQLLFSVMHAQAVEVAPGARWLGEAAIWVIEKRVVIMSALLPFLAVAYSFAAHRTESLSQSKKPGSLEREDIIVPITSVRGAKTAKDRCKELWLDYGLDKTSAYIADLAGCHYTTANKARLELREELEHEGTGEAS